MAAKENKKVFMTYNDMSEFFSHEDLEYDPLVFEFDGIQYGITKAVKEVFPYDDSIGTSSNPSKVIFILDTL